MARAGSTLEMGPRRYTVWFCVSKATFSMAKVCCTAVIMDVKSCAAPASSRWTDTTTCGSNCCRLF